MYKDPYSRPVVRLPFCFFALVLSFFLFGSCVRGAFQPVNAGREYGDPVPIMVSHLGQSSPHYFLQNVICFDYLCRKKIGKRKAMRAISFEDFKKRVAKNAKKGVYNKSTSRPKVVKPKPDTLLVKKVLEKVAARETPPAIAAPVLKADSLIILSELQFETNSYKLKGEHFSALDSLAKFLKEHPTLEAKVSGYTDNTGTERHNVILSERRAEVVAEYLIDRGAVFERVSFEGFGSSQPIRGNETEEGRRMNRRVEIVISNGKKY